MKIMMVEYGPSFVINSAIWHNIQPSQLNKRGGLITMVIHTKFSTSRVFRIGHTNLSKQWNNALVTYWDLQTKSIAVLAIITKRMKIFVRLWTWLLITWRVSWVDYMKSTFVIVQS